MNGAGRQEEVLEEPWVVGLSEVGLWDGFNLEEAQ